MTQLTDEALIFYAAPAVRTCDEDKVPAPDHRLLAMIPYEETVALVSFLTGSPERLAFRLDGACVMPIEPDGRPSLFPSLRAVMDSVSEINQWLAEVAACRGVLPVTPAWLETVPDAAERLLDLIRQRVARWRMLGIVLCDLHGQGAVIVIPPLQDLRASSVV